MDDINEGQARPHELRSSPDSSLIKRHDGEMDKSELHEQIEQEFVTGQVLPAELERIEASGTPAKTNAIAWAMAHLVMRKILEPSAGKPTVRLTKAAMRTFGVGQ